MDFTLGRAQQLRVAGTTLGKLVESSPEALELLLPKKKSKCPQTALMISYVKTLRTVSELHALVEAVDGKHFDDITNAL
eukprot:6867475-Karenia_brevis.AAC.1